MAAMAHIGANVPSQNGLKCLNGNQSTSLVRAISRFGTGKPYVASAPLAPRGARPGKPSFPHIGPDMCTRSTCRNSNNSRPDLAEVACSRQLRRVERRHPATFGQLGKRNFLEFCERARPGKSFAPD